MTRSLKVVQPTHIRFSILKQTRVGKKTKMSQYAACNVRCAACNVYCCCVEHGNLYRFAKGSSAYWYSHIFLKIQVHCLFNCSQTISSSQDHSLLNLLTLYLVSRYSLVTLCWLFNDSLLTLHCTGSLLTIYYLSTDWSALVKSLLNIIEHLRAVENTQT